LNTIPQAKPRHGLALKQRGVVLFFTLIALVVMSLAAVALIRSVDTSTMIAGNLAFRQAGTASGDSGIEAAIAWLTTAQTAATSAGLTVSDAQHPFNNTGGYDISNGTCCLNVAYRSNADPALSLTDSSATAHIKWDDTDSALVPDLTGNTVRYVIQRMSRIANAIPDKKEDTTTTPPKTGTLFSSTAVDKNGHGVLHADQICKGIGCPPPGAAALLRITAKVTGPKNTVSYIQTLVY
jgi:type IV pilus assembly protein PilX